MNREEEIQFTENDQSGGKPRLGIWVLVNVLIGIAFVFGCMMIVNRYIFIHVDQLKTAYYLSLLSSNIMFVLLILIIKASKRLSWVELGWKKVSIRAGIIDVFKVWGITMVIYFAYMFFLVYKGLTPPENQLSQLLQRPSLLALVINIFLIAVAAPFIEETLFRGMLFASMRPYLGCWTAVVISAAIFSGLHFELTGFVPRFILGIGLGYLYVKHQSIYPSIGLHALNNLLAVVMISTLS
ncbi:MAG: CPBP family intramembrane metalloprotease [Peptococcaceae bacterium]|nr:CPBP family intramembrane metalloprotease [Peptococcaceae bacterium]